LPNSEVIVDGLRMDDRASNRARHHRGAHDERCVEGSNPWRTWMNGAATEGN